jgi:propionyl-CoA synthetase
VVTALPKTRSGKILRKTLRQITAGDAYEIPSTIEDPSVLAALKEQIAAAHPATDHTPNTDPVVPS